MYAEHYIFKLKGPAMDPWSTNNNNVHDVDEVTGFQDSFCQHNESAPVLHVIAPAPQGTYGFNLTSEEYLHKLETKLTKVSCSRRKENKLSASMIINSLQSQKGLFFENMTNDYSSYDDYDDFSCPNKNLKAEIQRKFNPEQQALSQVELLCLPDNDVLSNVTSTSNLSDDKHDSSSDNPDH